MGVEFDGHTAARVVIDGDPDFAVRTRPKKSLRVVTSHLGGRFAPLQAQLLSLPRLLVALDFCAFGRHECNT